MEETKKCPYCGKEILAVAKKCKHCGQWLEGMPTRGQTPRDMSPRGSDEYNEKSFFEKYKWHFMIGIGIVIVAIIIIMSGQSNGSQASDDGGTYFETPDTIEEIDYIDTIAVDEY